MQNFNQHLLGILKVPAESLTLCSSFFQQKIVKKGDFVITEETKNNYTFFVEKGLLRKYSIDKNGKEHIIQFAPENWIISDPKSHTISDNARYYIDAIEDAEVIILPEGFFAELTKMHPDVSQYNFVLLVNHINALQKRINQLLGATAEERYVDFLKTYPNVFQRVPQWMVASYLGITPESLSRVRKELARKNFQTS